MLRSVADPRQHRLEDDAGQLQRGALEVDHVAGLHSLQRQRDHVGSEQRLEPGVGIVPERRDFDVDVVALAGVIADERKAGIAAAQVA
jgi:hypothetical protein